MDPLTFYKCLADDTRLRCLLMLAAKGELCVCELTEALALSQPKVSRHLAQLREAGLLSARRDGKWVFYRLAHELPAWASQVLALSLEGNGPFLAPQLSKLPCAMQGPQGASRCC
ncbi:metalloregulator ArsR/SmtB family transcription factor [Gallaecimonas kandeliae]|uniref:metalloregulator ArsR/SmtB family transcription factor n=1 Tax=Gallaecimonas kandeliae TaxID=3029055 RepID=UPI0026473845|nr:metalloregulator ArsR/SmtB family transcription factor [Gallaecimonas kandeliae]WKE67093.1 metalloregulator ArsR/SmtB family transcription factor [Gallaecimonas kandeliae]